jgi:hypothetical protein
VSRSLFLSLIIPSCEQFLSVCLGAEDFSMWLRFKWLCSFAEALFSAGEMLHNEAFSENMARIVLAHSHPMSHG